jgi:hypothetical protein
VALDQIAPELLLRPDRPYLATLAVAGHARAPDAKEVAEKAVDITIDKLPRHLAVEQVDAILAMVDGALRALLERRIMEHREYQSELFRGIYKKGEVEGEARGEARGEAKGRAEGKAEGVLIVLSSRGIPVSDAIRRRVLSCSNQKMLDAWLRRASVAATAAAVVGAKRARDRAKGNLKSRPPAKERGATSTHRAARRGRHNSPHE